MKTSTKREGSFENDLRITSDYSVEESPSPEEAKEAIDNAKDFAQATEAYLGNWLKQDSE